MNDAPRCKQPLLRSSLISCNEQLGARLARTSHRGHALHRRLGALVIGHHLHDLLCLVASRLYEFAAEAEDQLEHLGCQRNMILSVRARAQTGP